MSTDTSIVQSTLVPHAAFGVAIDRVEAALREMARGCDPVVLAVVGDSRTGKNRFITELLFQHPESRDGEGKIVPVLRVSAPSKPTPKALAEKILKRVGDPIWHRGTELEKTERVKGLLKSAQVRLLVLNEFQHFVDQGTHKVMHHVADWLKCLVEECHEEGWTFGLLVAGLPSCVAVIQQNEQLQGRFRAPIVMPRFDWLDDFQREEFVEILRSFHESLEPIFDLPILHDERVAFLFYCATGGLIGYLVNTLHLCETKARQEGRHVITLQHIADAHEEAIWISEAVGGMKSPFREASNYRPDDEALMAKIKEIGVKPTLN